MINFDAFQVLIMVGQYFRNEGDFMAKGALTRLAPVWNIFWWELIFHLL